MCNSVHARPRMGGFYGQGTGPIIADDINCMGNESSLAACGHRDWYTNNCRHNEDAGVICGGIATFGPSDLNYIKIVTQHQIMG